MAVKKFKSCDDLGLVELIRDGGVGVLPTDTIYGLVAAADSQTAVARLYGFKSRSAKPGTIIAASIDQLVGLGIQRRYLKAVEQYWPGPISVVIPAEPSLQYLHLGKFSLACRIPKDEALKDLLEKTGPLLTASANHPKELPAVTAKEAEKSFGEKVDFYVEGRNLSDHAPSTIIRVVDDAVEVLRAGAVKIDEASGQIID